MPNDDDGIDAPGRCQSQLSCPLAYLITASRSSDVNPTRHQRGPTPLRGLRGLNIALCGPPPSDCTQLKGLIGQDGMIGALRDPR